METSKDVGFRRVGHGNEGIGIGQAFLLEQLDIRRIAIDNKRIREQSTQVFAAFAVLLDEGDALFVFERQGGVASYASATGNHQVFNLKISTSSQFLHRVHLVGLAYDVGHIAGFENGVGVRDDGLAVPQDGHNAHLQSGIDLAQFLDRLAFDGRFLFESDEVHRQQTAAEIEKFGGDGMVEEIGYFLGGDAFGTHQFVDAEVAEHFAVLGRQQFGIGDARHRLLGLEFFGQNAGHQVDRFVVQHREEKVTILHVGLFEHLGRCRIAHDSQQVRLLLQSSQQFRVGVDNGDVVVQQSQRLGQIKAHFAIACNNDIHRIVYFLFFRLTGCSSSSITSIRSLST